jgi:hypothetical protein
LIESENGEVPSGIDNVVRDAAASVAAEQHLEVSVAPAYHVAAECAAAYAEHRHAVHRLLTLAATIATEPRALYVVIRPDGEPVTRLHVRGEGLPRMFGPVPEDQAIALRDLANEIKAISARLMVDQGGLFVLYGHFAEDDP